MKVNLLETEADEVRIEILPLIDVIFCILTFFIMASLTLTRQQAINLDLPKASTGMAQTRDLKVVSLDPSGRLFMDKQPTDQATLVKDLTTYLKTNPRGLVVLNASPTVSYNQVIQVLDLLRSVGGERVALATQATDRPELLNNPNSGTPITPGTTTPAPNFVPVVPDANTPPPPPPPGN